MTYTPPSGSQGADKMLLCLADAIIICKSLGVLPN